MTLQSSYDAIKAPREMTKGRSWKGDLNRPFLPSIVNRPHGFRVPHPDEPGAANEIAVENELMRTQILAAQTAEEDRKLSLLAEEFRVPLNDFRAIALGLAREFVPGFRADARKTTGRPKFWDLEKLFELVGDVREIRRKESLDTDREALRRLAARNKKWQPPASHRTGQGSWMETLESRLQEGKRQERRVREHLEMLDKFRSENSGKA